MDKIKSTDVIPVYDVTGTKIDEIRLPEQIMLIPARRGGFSEKGIYYKGSGILQVTRRWCIGSESLLSRISPCLRTARADAAGKNKE